MRRIRITLAAVLALSTAGCCSHFEEDWEAAGKLAVREDSLEGRWQGSWTSEASGHEGGLRAIVSKKENGFEAFYHATYTCLCFGFSFEYSVPMTAEKKGDAWAFKGSAELDSWIGGGHYDYDGTANATDYSAHYKSADDHGVFKLKRVR